ncbi:BON domain-containing protein [Pseudorhodoferax sp.]|uniref:BON domain-containing protein n=1 Tax=Pseudorhodoferax sp. TaxID=1993553 RepID=UPI002DD679B1|nr:BON domain-containing protein [Pseudorhodoferax sp.]
MNRQTLLAGGRRWSRPLTLALAVTLGAGTLAGCAPLLIGGAMIGGTMMVIDRRTSGAQVEDQAIELKSASRVRELALPGNVNVTSYNRMVLLTGEVTREADKAAVEQAVSRVDAVRSVVNDLAVMEPSTIGSRTNDGVLSGKVKASFIDAKDVQAQAAKVVTERGIVYLMGRVTEREANRYAEVARTVPGVQKVVRVFEIITEAELAQIQPAPKN